MASKKQRNLARKLKVAEKKKKGIVQKHPYAASGIAGAAFGAAIAPVVDNLCSDPLERDNAIFRLDELTNGLVAFRNYYSATTQKEAIDFVTQDLGLYKEQPNVETPEEVRELARKRFKFLEQA